MDVLNTEDYYTVINHHKHAVPRSGATGRIFALFVSGGGYGSGSNYEGSGEFDLYELSGCLGKQLTKIGTLSEYQSGYESSSVLRLDGHKPVSMPILFTSACTKIWLNE